MRRDAGRKGQRIKTSAVAAIGEQWLCNVVLVSAVHKSAISILVAVEWLSHVRLFNPMDGSRPDSPVLHFDPELAQTHVHGVGDASQPSSYCCSLLLLPSVFPSIRVSKYIFL